MVIQSLTFSDLCWCFLLQHFFANLQDKMDQKHFEEFHTTDKILSSVQGCIALVCSIQKETGNSLCFYDFYMLRTPSK